MLSKTVVCVHVMRSVFMTKSLHLLEMCGKPTFGSDLVFKNRTVQKFDIHSDVFPTETGCNPPFK